VCAFSWPELLLLSEKSGFPTGFHVFTTLRSFGMNSDSARISHCDCEDAATKEKNNIELILLRLACEDNYKSRLELFAGKDASHRTR